MIILVVLPSFPYSPGPHGLDPHSSNSPHPDPGVLPIRRKNNDHHDYNDHYDQYINDQRDFKNKQNLRLFWQIERNLSSDWNSAKDAQRFIPMKNMNIFADKQCSQYF
jgi:hypothetical protein